MRIGFRSPATVGSAIGSYFGGPIGGTLGSMAGALIDQAIFGGDARGAGQGAIVLEGDRRTLR